MHFYNYTIEYPIFLSTEDTSEWDMKVSTCKYMSVSEKIMKPTVYQGTLFFFLSTDFPDFTGVTVSSTDCVSLDESSVKSTEGSEHLSSIVFKDFSNPRKSAGSTSTLFGLSVPSDDLRPPCDNSTLFSLAAEEWVSMSSLTPSVTLKLMLGVLSLDCWLSWPLELVFKSVELFPRLCVFGREGILLNPALLFLKQRTTWATTSENRYMYLGFLTRSDTKRAVQAQKMARRGLKFWI